MTDIDYEPFAPALPPAPARALPWATVAAGSLLTTLPFIAPAPILPPCGLLMLLAWRLLSRFSLRLWAAAPLGFLDDLLSGQPLGSAVLLWSLCFLLIEFLEQRLVFRDFWQDWAIATGAVAFCLIGGRFLATPLSAPIDSAVAVQIGLSALLFPVASRIAAWLDAKRSQP